MPPIGLTGSTWVENTRTVWAAEALSPDKLIPGGAKLAASQFNAEDAAVVTLTADADPGDTSLAVAALANPIPTGSLLDFGSRAAQTVTMAASALAAATSITVVALTAPLPAGTVLYFGTNKFARVATDAAAGATTVAVTAIPTALSGSETATVTASSIVAKTTANAIAGATTLTVEQLAEPILTGDVATYAGAGVKKKRVPSGTLIGRTYTERDAGTGFGPWANGDDEPFLVAFEITDAADRPEVELVSHGTKVYENNLPGWSTYSSQAKTALRAAYQTMLAPAG
jgi:hypothetical protein